MSGLSPAETPVLSALSAARSLMADFSAEALKDGTICDQAVIEDVAASLRHRFGEQSATVAAWSAFLAWNDDRQAAYQFWCNVFASLQPRAQEPL